MTSQSSAVPSAGFVEDVGGEAIDDPTAVEAHVELARTARKSSSNL